MVTSPSWPGSRFSLNPISQTPNSTPDRRLHSSAVAGKLFRGPLPSGYDAGDFGVDLRALILSLKYCGNMSEPKIREFLENFAVQVSAGSLSNILTNTAAAFEPEYHAVLVAGLSSTPYQQTDDTSARVAGQSWHTHVLCNPFYTWYSTRPGKDRLSVLAMLQNQPQPRFRFNPQTLTLLRDEFSLPGKWQQSLAAWLAQRGGDVEYDAPSLKSLLDDWFGGSCQQLRTALEQAAAIVAYRRQTSVPVIQVLVCDDAGQFKLLTDHLALCWIHAGRHYERLAPVVPGHARALDNFAERFWDFYAVLQDYRAGPSAAWAAKLRAEFDTLFATRTGYDALDDRIAKTAAKKDALLTVLSHPAVPLHNNASELGARVSARRRDVSLHSRSPRGARAMDIFTTLVQTCKKCLLSRICGWIFAKNLDFIPISLRFSRRKAMNDLILRTSPPFQCLDYHAVASSKGRGCVKRALFSGPNRPKPSLNARAMP